MKKLAILLAAAALTAPAAAQPARDAPKSITYRSGACFGRCPIYEVTVRSDGRATFNGINFTTVRGTREFRDHAGPISRLRPPSGADPPLARLGRL